VPVVSPPIAKEWHARITNGVETFTVDSGTNRVGWQNSNNSHFESALRVGPINVARGSTINSFFVDLFVNVTGTLTLSPVKSYLQSAPTPADIADYNDFRTRTRASVVTTSPGPSHPAGAFYRVDFTAQLQALVNLSSWEYGSSPIFMLSAANLAGPDAQYLYFRTHTYSVEAERPILTLDFTAPTITASLNGALPVLQAGPLTGTTEEPEPIYGEIAGGTLPSLMGVLLGGEPDYSKNTLYPVHRPYLDTHHLVTEAGEVLGLSAGFDRTLGGVREEVVGAGDESWYPASNLPTRVPGPLGFRALLADREHPKLDGDRLVRLLPDVRELHYPDGRVLGLWRGADVARPRDNVVELSLQPKGARPHLPILEGEVNAAFETVDSTPELPIYAFDPAGYITAPLTPKRVAHGTLSFGVRLDARGTLSLVSVGEPIDAAGTAALESVNVSYQDNQLVVSLWGAEWRLRESSLGTFGAVWVFVLVWTRHGARLVSVTERGLQGFALPIGTPVDLTQRVLTAGARSGGAFIALGSSSLGAPFFSLRPLSQREQDEAALALYGELTHPSLTWEVAPPDLSLTLSRLDSKALEMAPGESITLDFEALRVGPFTGALEASVKASTGITASVATLTTGTVTNTYRATISAPSAAVEGRYTFRLEVKAVGADEPGSLLANVRAEWDAFVEVAASPAIMPNATLVRRAYDPTSRRASEMLRDYSANANTSSWSGYARPDREYIGLLATGRFNAAIFTGALANAAQAQRMSGEMTFCMVYAEVSKTPVDGVMYQIAADGSENGVHLLRAQGGFKLRTVNGATTVTSPDTLAYSSGYARLIVLITLTDVFLVDRDGGKSIRLARPAWADAGVRTTVGALRSAAGAYSSVTRTHLLADTAHPYALSEIQRRRNIDALTPYCPASDGKGEFADNALGIFLWDDGAQKYLNHAAPALGITAVPVGTVDSIAGGVYPRGSSSSASYVLIETGVPSSNVLTMLTSILDFKGSHTVAYEAQLGVSDTSVNTGSAHLARHDNGQPFAMIRKTDFNHNYGTVSYTPVSGDNLFKFRFVPNEDKLEVTALANGNSRTVTTTNSYTGTLNVTLGAIRRADGNIDRRTPTKNRGLIVCRGEVTADDIATAKVLLPA
jgi:hypothetical protein